MNRKKMFWIGLIVLLVMYPASALFAEEVRIATIDLSRAFDEFKKTKEADKTLQAKGSEKKTERDKKIAEIKKLKDELELLSDKGRQEKQAVIDQKVKELQEFDREVRDSLRQERDQMVQEILREIDQVIKGYGDKNGYTLILNDRVLLYKEKTLDITNDVIQLLNGESKER
ncbi:MAG: OmpH family outer membrane protein [Candidatus Omnitrophica bacterium]|nr:OmpH family outer membrane protein [Candidatus Omnitrophota bacterium]